MKIIQEDFPQNDFEKYSLILEEQRNIKNITKQKAIEEKREYNKTIIQEDKDQPMSLSPYQSKINNNPKINSIFKINKTTKQLINEQEKLKEKSRIRGESLIKKTL